MHPPPLLTTYAPHPRPPHAALCSHGRARAIDGSPGSYHIAAAGAGSANASKWHLHLQGGGWCWDVPGCAGRALGSKGSSDLSPNNHSIKILPDEASCPGLGYFSADPARNPTMHDWNHVHVNYVDGGSFAGNRSDPVIDPKTNRTAFSGSISTTLAAANVSGLCVGITTQMDGALLSS